MLKKTHKEKIFTLMARSRALEERLIKMAKSSDGFFWIGGPGEEAFNVPLGILVHKGEGLKYDYLHFHYRASACMLAMGENMLNPIRQMANVATDPYSGGRNFVSHFAKKEWNVMPVNSPIEVQYGISLGTARAQSKNKTNGISIVTGGDAGSAEGDFASCLGWANMPKKELPLLIIVTNNKHGISTPFNEVHGDAIIAKRAEAFGIKWATVNGNDPEESFEVLMNAMNYVRKERKPFCLEAYVSRLHGHSSSSGGNRVEHETDCLEEYQKKLTAEGVLSKSQCDQIYQMAKKEADDALKVVRHEPSPSAETIFDHTFKENT